MSFREEVKRVLEIKGPVEELVSSSDISKLDSLGIVEVITLVEENHNITLTFEEIRKMKTYGELTERIARG